jgi:two-component system, OmpR family, alkaline phosphatase synthesis response regulator PhoP
MQFLIHNAILLLSSVFKISTDMNLTLQKKILYADTEESQKQEIITAFEREGYDVYFVVQGAQVVSNAIEIKPDVIVLDVILPQIDGIEICYELRKLEEFRLVPIVFVSSRSEDFTQIAALEAGGDDFLVKPVRPRLVMSHIKAILRRYNFEKTEKIENIADSKPKLQINEENMCVTFEGQNIYLPLKEFNILKLLTSKPGRIFTRNEIFTKIWASESTTNERTIDVYVRRLRQKIGDEIIVTFRGIGYKVVI